MKGLKKAGMLTREEISKMSMEEMQKAMMADVVTFTEYVDSKKEVQELKDLEEKLMDTFKENDEYLGNVKYTLPDETEYDEVKVSRTELDRKIVYLLNKLEVEFRATLGVYQAIKFWKKSTKEIPYNVFDSTLRLLGTLKFKGADECFDVIVINNWFTNAHEQYLRDNAYTQYLAAYHQAIMNAMEKLSEDDKIRDTDMANEM